MFIIRTNAKWQSSTMTPLIYPHFGTRHFWYSFVPPEHMSFGHWVVNTAARIPSTCINVRLRRTPPSEVPSPLKGLIPRIFLASSIRTYVREGVKLVRSQKRNHVICYPTIYNCISRQHTHMASPETEEIEMTSSQNYYEVNIVLYLDYSRVLSGQTCDSDFGSFPCLHGKLSDTILCYA